MTKPTNASVNTLMKHLLLTLLFPLTLYAQAPGVAIANQSRPSLKKEKSATSDQVECLMGDRELLPLAETKAALKKDAIL